MRDGDQALCGVGVLPLLLAPEGQQVGAHPEEARLGSDSIEYVENRGTLGEVWQPAATLRAR